MVLESFAEKFADRLGALRLRLRLVLDPMVERRQYV
jgi:hypothetical protein